MSCPSCKAELPEASAFCNKCGAALAPPQPFQAPAPGPAEPEQEVWRGRFSGKAYAHWWALWVLWIVALIVAYFKFQPEGGYGIARYGFVAAAFVPVLLLLWSWLVARYTTRYRLTTLRLFRETGILSRQMNEVELLRVDDVAVRQNLVQRVLNVGVVTVISPTDQTEPRLELVGIENPIEVKEQIRALVRKRRDRSIHMESL